MKKRYKILLFLISLGVLNFCLAARDPFYLEEKIKLKKIYQKNKQMHKYLLEGIIEVGGRLAAVINDGNESRVVLVNDHIGRYLVEKIDCNVVVISHGKKTQKLELD